MINIKLFKPIEKQKEFYGILEKYSENELELRIDDKLLKFDMSNIATAKTVAEEI